VDPLDLTAMISSLYFRARLVRRAWKNVFERPDTVAQEWAEYLVGPEVERRLNAARLRTYNRPADCWAADDGERVGSAGG